MENKTIFSKNTSVQILSVEQVLKCVVEVLKILVHVLKISL